MFISKISKLTKQEVKTIFDAYGKWLFGIGFLVGFLLFLLNIFLSISLYTSSLSNDLREKLGIYFYIKDTPGEENITYKKIITLKEDLEKQGLQVIFSSKEDAFKFLEKRVPELIKNLEKFDIENPLPATLYVMFKNDKQYNILRDSILKYKELILNIKDIDQSSTVKQQENRVLNIINFSNFIKILSYTLIGILGIIIILFLTFLTKNIFNHFLNDLGIKKILGATTDQIKESFLRSLLIVILIAFVVNIILLIISGYVGGYYIDILFDFSLFSIIGKNIFYIIITLIIELAIITFISLYSSSKLIKTLNDKL